MGAPERVDESAHRDANSATSSTIAANGEEKVATNNIIAAVRCKPSTERELLVQQRVRICQNETTKAKEKWQKEVVISPKYQVYRKPFTSMLPEI